MKDFVLKGHICYTKKSKEFEVCPNSFLVCKDGVSKGVYSVLPEEYKDWKSNFEKKLKYLETCEEDERTNISSMACGPF